MPQAAHSRSWIIALSLLVALMLTAMPLPEWAVNWRPAWVAMVLIYWCMALPDRVGIGISWTLGLLLDVQQGTVLGQNALGLAVIAFITLKSHQRLRVFPLVQQAFLVCGYILLFQIIVLWIKSMLGIPPMHWSYWMPAFSSMLLWPWIFIILRDVRRKFKVQ